MFEAMVAKPTWSEGQQWEHDGIIYRAEKLKRKEVMGGWDPVFSVIETLANNYGDDGVRLIVWFIF